MPIKRRKPRGTPTPPSPPVSAPGRGVYVTPTGASSIAWAGTHPEATLAGVLLDWSTYQTNSGMWNATVDAELRASTVDALDNDYALAVTLLAGADSPIGRPGTSQPEWLSLIHI